MMPLNSQGAINVIAPCGLCVEMAWLKLLFMPINRLLKMSTFQCHIFTVLMTKTLASETSRPAEKLSSRHVDVLECEFRLSENCHVITSGGFLRLLFTYSLCGWYYF